jgi:hypothetical protein
MTTNSQIASFVQESERQALINGAAHVPAGWEMHYANNGAPAAPPHQLSSASSDDRSGVASAGSTEPLSGEKTATTQAPQEEAGGRAAAVGARPSGDSEGGYVIYQQTTALVNMLNREVVSVLD